MLHADRRLHFNPPVFILLGLLDVWVPREIMVKYMGEGSGIKGILLSILIGSAAAGDIVGGKLLALLAFTEGKAAAQNALGIKSKVNYNAVHSCTETTNVYIYQYN